MCESISKSVRIQDVICDISRSSENDKELYHHFYNESYQNLDISPIDCIKQNALFDDIAFEDHIPKVGRKRPFGGMCNLVDCDEKENAHPNLNFGQPKNSRKENTQILHDKNTSARGCIKEENGTNSRLNLIGECLETCRTGLSLICNDDHYNNLNDFYLQESQDQELEQDHELAVIENYFIDDNSNINIEKEATIATHISLDKSSCNDQVTFFLSKKKLAEVSHNVGVLTHIDTSLQGKLSEQDEDDNKSQDTTATQEVYDKFETAFQKHFRKLYQKYSKLKQDKTNLESESLKQAAQIQILQLNISDCKDEKV